MKKNQCLSSTDLNECEVEWWQAWPKANLLHSPDRMWKCSYAVVYLESKSVKGVQVLHKFCEK